MYNIVTVSNKSYQEFLIYFINSLLKNCDISKINKIFVLNNGVDEDLIKSLILKHEKIIIVDNDNQNNKITTSGWSTEWGNNVDTKTLFFKQILEETKLPSFLIDVDCFFLKDFTDIINFNSDVALCDRYSVENRYIGSFVYLNYTNNALDFLNKWILNQHQTIGYPKETKCLNKTYKEFFNKIKIDTLDFKKINFYYTPSDKNELDSIYIVHLKGAVKKDTFEEEIQNRINRLNSFVDINLYK